MSTTPAAADTWRACVGAATWLEEPLKATLSYAAPLPVQQVVVPTVARALLSGIPMDVSLTAPTGSGKTLCYLLPMLQLITQEKKGLNDTRLRALVLVPTAALGQQVFREITRLTRHTTITAASLCTETAAMGQEADLLVRRVRASPATGPTPRLPAVVPAGGERIPFDGERGDDREVFAVHDAAQDDGCATAEDGSDDVGGRARYHYFSLVDILVATPQRLLRHLDSTPGLALASLRLLVIDEADQVLAGNFANFVVKVVERFEEEQRLGLALELASRQHQQQQQQQQQEQEQEQHFSLPFNGHHTGVAGLPTAPAAATHTLHKMLCSATLSSRIGRISEVRLRNCQYFALGTDGVAVPPQEKAATASANGAAGDAKLVVRTDFALPPTLHEHMVFVEDQHRHAVLLKLVRSLLDKMDEKHARRRAAQERLSRMDDDDDHVDGEADVEGEDNEKEAHRSPGQKKMGKGALVSSSYPTVDDDAGTGILIFCSSAEEARVMGHFLAAAGVQGVIEFTTLTSESERRRALLQQHVSTSSASSSPASASAPARPRSNIVVASDALMRGIDIPNTGHVIMYHPPDSLSQYVHRAGRTARAMRPGHLHVLLSKLGPSGTQEDGEVAAFRRLSGLVARTLPQVYERHFFLFAKAPVAAAPAPGGDKKASKKKGKTEAPPATAAAASVAESAAVAVGEEGQAGPPHEDHTEDPSGVGAKSESAAGETTKDEVAATTTAAAAAAAPGEYAEWWVAEADRFLAKSQQQLNVKWASVLDAQGAAETAHKFVQSGKPSNGSVGVKSSPSGRKRTRSTSPTK